MSLPDTLTVLPLDNKVLLPLAVVKVALQDHEVAVLSKKFSRLSEQRKIVHVVCVPLQPPALIHEESDTSHASRDRLGQHGCMGRIIRFNRSGSGGFVFVEGLSRCQVDRYSDDGPMFLAKVRYPPTITKAELEEAKNDIIAFRALSKEFLVRMKDLKIPEALVEKMSKLIDTVPPYALADLLVSVIETSFEEKLLMLSTTDMKQRLLNASQWMTRQLHALRISEQIHSSIEGKLTKKQREFYLRQQLEAIKQELNDIDGVGEGKEDELVLLGNKLQKLNLPQEVNVIAVRELRRLKKLQPSSSEWSVTRNYLDLIADLPWNKRSDDLLDIRHAKQQLENDHFGLEHVKKRIIEYLSVMKVKKDLKAPILCFVGPPGVGKTSLGRSIASALSRNFHRISLGGVRDEAEMRGHRRTYVGAMPGLIIQGLRKCGVNNPLILLDEIDKLVHSSHYGDPAAALLEVLDPEQNHTFSDHFLNVPFDLSTVLFIATANSVDTIPEPLLDRMELIHLSGYTFDEKLHIAKSHLLPKQISAHGMEESHICMPDDVLLHLAEDYTRESGVRHLERTIASVVRSKCVALAELRESGSTNDYSPNITLEDLKDILGISVYEKEVAEREPIPGVVTGLAYSGSGHGGILFIESTKMPGSGTLQLTGSLGDVIKESAQIALTWVKSNAYRIRLTPTHLDNIVEKYDVHIHMPSGAVPKDGPSAGVTFVTSLVSLFSGCHVLPTTAMTGEVSLRGQVLPVGGIKEKVISAHRAGIRKVILPLRNQNDIISEVPDNVQKDIEFVYVKNVWEVLEAALVMKVDEQWNVRSFESHL
ncbi:ATP-dependent protease La [Spinellus fusiger]|nr:ATP-dependent protease La [Spinellus fusiger]